MRGAYEGGTAERIGYALVIALTLGLFFSFSLSALAGLWDLTARGVITGVGSVAALSLAACALAPAWTAPLELSAARWWFLVDGPWGRRALLGTPVAAALTLAFACGLGSGALVFGSTDGSPSLAVAVGASAAALAAVVVLGLLGLQTRAAVGVRACLGLVGLACAGLTLALATAPRALSGDPRNGAPTGGAAAADPAQVLWAGVALCVTVLGLAALPLMVRLVDLARARSAAALRSTVADSLAGARLDVLVPEADPSAWSPFGASRSGAMTAGRSWRWQQIRAWRRTAPGLVLCLVGAAVAAWALATTPPPGVTSDLGAGPRGVLVGVGTALMSLGLGPWLAPARRAVRGEPLTILGERRSRATWAAVGRASVVYGLATALGLALGVILASFSIVGTGATPAPRGPSLALAVAAGAVVAAAAGVTRWWLLPVSNVPTALTTPIVMPGGDPSGVFVAVWALRGWLPAALIGLLATLGPPAVVPGGAILVLALGLTGALKLSRVDGS